MFTSTLRPGLLVSVKTSVRGNVRYATTTLEAEHLVGDMKRARWETEKTVLDADEHERALKARSLARSAIQTVCSHSAFGLMCPEDKADKLEAAVNKARDICGVFNSTASITRVECYVMVGKVSPDDVEAVKAINSEVRDLMDTMARGLANMDVQVVRDAANKARSVGKMLEPNAQERVQKAIEVARAAAREVVKAGEAGAIEIDEVAIQRIVETRTSFLDIEETTVGTVEAAGRTVQVDDDEAYRIEVRETDRQRAIDLGIDPASVEMTDEEIDAIRDREVAEQASWQED